MKVFFGTYTDVVERRILSSSKGTANISQMVTSLYRQAFESKVVQLVTGLMKTVASAWWFQDAEGKEQLWMWTPFLMHNVKKDAENLVNK